MIKEGFDYYREDFLYKEQFQILFEFSLKDFEYRIKIGNLDYCPHEIEDKVLLSYFNEFKDYIEDQINF